jgi:hypothetical protein
MTSYQVPLESTISEQSWFMPDFDCLDLWICCPISPCPMLPYEESSDLERHLSDNHEIYQAPLTSTVQAISSGYGSPIVFSTLLEPYNVGFDGAIFAKANMCRHVEICKEHYHFCGVVQLEMGKGTPSREVWGNYDYEKGQMCEHYGTNRRCFCQLHGSEEKEVGLEALKNHSSKRVAERLWYCQVFFLSKLVKKTADPKHNCSCLIICDCRNYKGLGILKMQDIMPFSRKSNMKTRGMSSAEVKILVDSESACSTIFSDEENASTSPASETEISNYDHSSSTSIQDLEADESKKAVGTQPGIIYGSGPVDPQETKRATLSITSLNLNENNRYDSDYGDMRSCNHNSFKADSAHSYWTWSEEERNWWHKDEETDILIWAPFDYD